MGVRRSVRSGLLIADDVREDGQVGVGIAREGVHVVVMPAKGCFSAGTELSPTDAREIARELNELADRVEARDGKAE